MMLLQKLMVMSNSFKIAVVGAGSWGTALAILLGQKFNRVTLWAHRSAHSDDLNRERENKKYLPGISFPDSIYITDSLEWAVTGASVIVMVVPSHSYRDVFERIIPYLGTNCRIVSAVKGIENNSLMTMTQVMEEVLSGYHKSVVPYRSCDNLGIELGVLSGPSFAKEVANSVPTAVTIGFKNLEVAKEIQNIFVTDFFRVYASTDLIGLEISAALKNIIAIATGVCDGLGYGLNTRAALITRGLAEITRLGITLGAEESTFSGLSGVGDLLLTCTGSLSRNRTVGLMLGEGKKLAQIKDEMQMVAEGIKTTRSVFELSKSLGIDMPILEQVYKIIYEDKDCAEAVSDLLNRELKVE
ncbi:MAG: glycerol-3-phosphate dehydrogenase (NAD(P)+) [Desulforhopalus sp.]|jgi:glycerol-3-phosphate dehydrogenase (NAD(P)+)